MAIPAIDPYELPTAEDLPIGRVAWEADPERAVLLIHDMQRYFARPFTPNASPLRDVVPRIEDLRTLARGSRRPGALQRAARCSDAFRARAAVGLLGPRPVGLPRGHGDHRRARARAGRAA